MNKLNHVVLLWMAMGGRKKYGVLDITQELRSKKIVESSIKFKIPIVFYFFTEIEKPKQK